jgi:ArsR family metal-binding transcriptional regulator
MDKLIEDYKFRLVEPECAPGSARWGVQLDFPGDISAVFPYLNSVERNAWYDHEGKVLILREDEQAYALRPHEVRIARAKDNSQAEQLSTELVERLNGIWQERDSITPLYKERSLPTVIDILRLLPQTNCRECGYPTCMAFAAVLRQDLTQLERCSPLYEPEYAENRERVLNLFSTD